MNNVNVVSVFVGGASGIFLLLLLVYIASRVASYAYFKSKQEYQQKLLNTLSKGERNEGR
jgi:hypothetical protein